MAIPHAIDLTDADLPCASDVAYDIINNQVTDFDYAEWDSVTLENQADLLKDIIGEIASFKRDSALTNYENQSELLSAIKDCISDTLIVWAKKEGYPQ